MKTGREEEAAVMLGRVSTADIARDAGTVITVALYSEVAAALGSDEQRRMWLDMAAEQVGMHLISGGSYNGPASRLCALLCASLGDTVRATAWFEQAIRESDEMRSPPFATRSRLDFAEFLIALGDLDRAVNLLDETESRIGELGLVESIRRLDELRTHIYPS